MPFHIFRADWNNTLRGVTLCRGGLSMAGMIQIFSGIVIGGTGFYQIGAHPVQGVCALFLAGFLIIVGLDKELFGDSR
ncbi:MAG: hypothetical protein ACP5IL_14685 [Syntrophobacteraceae bacterium]